MLDDLRRSLESHADAKVPEWRSLSKIELCNRYVDIEGDKDALFECRNNPLKSAYFVAIVAKYWNSIHRCYNKVYKTASPEECYDMVVEGIMCALKLAPWRNPSNKLYNDPKGPDKAINVAISSSILTYYQFSNTMKRKANFAAMSVDYLHDEFGDTAFRSVAIEDREPSTLVTSLVRKNFTTQNYIASFIIDGAAYGDCLRFSKEPGGSICSTFSKRLLLKHIREIDDRYAAVFSERYHLDKAKVDEAVSICHASSPARIDTILRKTFESLRHSKCFEE